MRHSKATQDTPIKCFNAAGKSKRSKEIYLGN